MKKESMYKRGQRINLVAEVIHCVQTGRWIMLRGKPKHPEIIGNMSLSTILMLIKDGLLHQAERT